LRTLIGLLLVALAFFAARSSVPVGRPYCGLRGANPIGLTEDEILAYWVDPLAPIPRPDKPEWGKYRAMQTVDQP
jgi:hypothetical protein